MNGPSYVTCPGCGSLFAEPVRSAPASYSLVRTHTAGETETCRVVVTVHPDGRVETEEVPTEGTVNLIS